MDGQTQAAHANWGKYGKGMGMKAHDCFVAALCQTCHFAIDQGAKMTAEERVNEWEAESEMMYYRLQRVKVGERFKLCRTGEVYTMIAVRPETPSGYRRDCVDSKGQSHNFHHSCKVRVIHNTQD